MEKGKKIFIGGNWKCNGNKSFISSYEEIVKSFEFDKDKVEVTLFPSFVHLEEVNKLFSKYNVNVGSQNISKYGNGAFTGETSCDLLADIGIKTTLIGHSERRQFFGDDEETISAKIKKAEEHGFLIVFCIGENLDQRESQKTLEVIKSQLETAKNSVKNWSNIVIAYEPVWAIGTGKTASPQEAEEVHEFIRKWLETNLGNEIAYNTVRIIYGGSVTEKNCEQLIKQKNIDGFLVGGASLKKEFKQIVESYKLN